MPDISYTGRTRVAFQFIQTGHLGIYPVTWANKSSADQASTITPNVRFWHKALLTSVQLFTELQVKAKSGLRPVPAATDAGG
jgi:hypothetical protein